MSCVIFTKVLPPRTFRAGLVQELPILGELTRLTLLTRFIFDKTQDGRMETQSSPTSSCEVSDELSLRRPPPGPPGFWPLLEEPARLSRGEDLLSLLQWWRQLLTN